MDYEESQISFLFQNDEQLRTKRTQVSKLTSKKIKELEDICNSEFNEYNLNYLMDKEDLFDEQKPCQLKFPPYSYSHEKITSLKEFVEGDNYLTEDQIESLIIQRYHQILETGTWSSKRLPKILEPLRSLNHWDYLLLEMKWMAIDFSCERKFKMELAKQISYEVIQYFLNKHLLEQREMEKLLVYRTRVTTIWSRAITDYWKERNKHQFDAIRSKPSLRLSPHQIEGSKWLLSKFQKTFPKIVLLADEHGLKKKSTILSFLNFKKIQNCYNKLIITHPYLLSQWYYELTSQHHNVYIRKETEAFVTPYSSPCHVFLTTYSSLLQYPSRFAFSSFSIVILDDCHVFCDSTNQFTPSTIESPECLLSTIPVIDGFKYEFMILLSDQFPNSFLFKHSLSSKTNKEDDIDQLINQNDEKLFLQFKPIIDVLFYNFTSMKEFSHSFPSKKDSSNSESCVNFKKHFPFIQQSLSKCCLRRTQFSLEQDKSNQFCLSKKESITILCPMTSMQRRLYDKTIFSKSEPSSLLSMIKCAKALNEISQNVEYVAIPSIRQPLELKKEFNNFLIPNLLGNYILNNQSKLKENSPRGHFFYIDRINLFSEINQWSSLYPNTVQINTSLVDSLFKTTFKSKLNSKTEILESLKNITQVHTEQFSETLNFYKPNVVSSGIRLVTSKFGKLKLLSNNIKRLKVSKKTFKSHDCLFRNGKLRMLMSLARRHHKKKVLILCTSDRLVFRIVAFLRSLNYKSVSINSIMNLDDQQKTIFNFNESVSSLFLICSTRVLTPSLIPAQPSILIHFDVEWYEFFSTSVIEYCRRIPSFNLQFLEMNLLDDSPLCISMHLSNSGGFVTLETLSLLDITTPYSENINEELLANPILKTDDPMIILEGLKRVLYLTERDLDQKSFAKYEELLMYCHNYQNTVNKILINDSKDVYLKELNSSFYPNATSRIRFSTPPIEYVEDNEVLSKIDFYDSLEKEEKKGKRRIKYPLFYDPSILNSIESKLPLYAPVFDLEKPLTYYDPAHVEAYTLTPLESRSTLLKRTTKKNEKQKKEKENEEKKKKRKIFPDVSRPNRIKNAKMYYNFYLQGLFKEEWIYEEIEAIAKCSEFCQSKNTKLINWKLASNLVNASLFDMKRFRSSKKCRKFWSSLLKAKDNISDQLNEKYLHCLQNKKTLKDVSIAVFDSIQVIINDSMDSSLRKNNDLVTIFNKMEHISHQNALNNAKVNPNLMPIDLMKLVEEKKKILQSQKKNLNLTFSNCT